MSDSKYEPDDYELDDWEYEGSILDLSMLGVDADTQPLDGGLAPIESIATPLIAIVGRPNVGKSRLFNRLTGTRFAIVEDLPGVTRDRQYGEGEWYGRAFHVVDTGGFEPESADVLLRQMREQARVAIEEADIILFVMDGQAGLVPADGEIATMLRQSRKLVFPIANKLDGPKHDMFVGEFYELGFERIFGISAEHGRGMDDLMDEVAAFLPKTRERPKDDNTRRVAVIGRPNAGKSTLVNALLGEDRLLTSDIPGTTRDAINTHLVHDGQPYLFVDTAGIRRKRSIAQQVEKYSVVQAFKAIDRADIVLYVIDATQGVTAQDQRIVGLAHDKGRSMILLLNKWDLVEKDHTTAGQFVKQLRDDLKFARYAPVVTISAKTRQRVHRIFPLIDAVYTQWSRRVGTGEFNRFLEATLRRNPPKPQRRKQLKVFYGSQVASSPPTFMFVVNDDRLLHFSYERYLLNSIRRQFTFEGTPVKMFFRPRPQKEKGEALG